MGKTAMGPQTLIYPMPTLLVGANVDGKANFMAVAWGGIAGGDPPMVSVAIRHSRYTLKGIRQNMTFSVNVPSADIVRETDYCGLVSGADTDKINDCKFNIFYGDLDTAPLIRECPVNLECEVVQILNLGSHACIIGKIKEVHVSEECLTDGDPDLTKIKPIVFARGTPSKYYTTGEFLAEAFRVGLELKAKKKS